MLYHKARNFNDFRYMNTGFILESDKLQVNKDPSFHVFEQECHGQGTGVMASQFIGSHWILRHVNVLQKVFRLDVGKDKVLNFIGKSLNLLPPPLLHRCHYASLKDYSY